jgi:AcrR family transcriptional regulator
VGTPARQARRRLTAAPGRPFAESRTAIMIAAQEVFVAQGFTEASIADIVDRAGSSVGSLYHHFGGKAELYLALYQEHVTGLAEISRKAVAAARQAGASDPAELFLAAARAQLAGSWLSRDAALLFFTDGPPGFEDLRRQVSRTVLADNDAWLELSDGTFDRLYAAALWALVNDGVREVIASKTRRQANLVMDGVIEYARRLMAAGPWTPPARSPDVIRPARWPAAPAEPPDRPDRAGQAASELELARR